MRRKSTLVFFRGRRRRFGFGQLDVRVAKHTREREASAKYFSVARLFTEQKESA
jgi:hypothetical protein